MVEDCSPYPYFRFACRDQAAVAHSSARYLYRDGALAFLVALCLFHRFQQNLVQNIAHWVVKMRHVATVFWGYNSTGGFNSASLFSCCLKKFLKIIWGKSREVHSIPFPSECCLLTSFLLRDGWWMTACIVFQLTPICESPLFVSRPSISGNVTNPDGSRLCLADRSMSLLVDVQWN